jgi:hypothetical protein
LFHIHEAVEKGKAKEEAHEPTHRGQDGVEVKEEGVHVHLDVGHVSALEVDLYFG